MADNSQAGGDGDSSAATQEAARASSDSGQQAAAQQTAEQAGQGAATSGEGTGGADGRQDPYEVIASLLSDPDGQEALALVASSLNRGGGSGEGGSQQAAPAASRASTAEADANRAELERKADDGDVDALQELRRLDREQQQQNGVREKLRGEAAGEALASFLRAPEIQQLPEADRLRLVNVYSKQGAEATVSEAIKLVTARGPANGNGAGEGSSPTGEQQAQRARDNAAVGAANRATGSPDLPGASSAGGPPPIEPGKKPDQVLDDYFAWKDSA